EGCAATAAGGGGARARRLLHFLRLLVPLGRRGRARVVARADERVSPVSGAGDAYARWDAVVGCRAFAEKPPRSAHGSVYLSS
ncbi:Os06g0694900, partial [Oryza sativa Japonica Group]